MDDDKEHPQYLGDGVYASYDGYHIWLKTQRDGRWESIALEPEVFQSLFHYALQHGWTP